MGKKKSKKRELIEWAVMLSVFGLLYVTGWHTEVIGTLQRVVVASGIIQPSLEDKAVQASYDVYLEDVEGNRVSMSSMKGQTIFMNLWATWCPPCIAEMPDIQNLYHDTRQDVTFIMLSRDEDEERARQWIARKGYDFPIYFLRSSLPPVYRTQAIPTTFVVSPDGKITVRNSGMAKYNTASFKEYLRSL